MVRTHVHASTGRVLSDLLRCAVDDCGELVIHHFARAGEFGVDATEQFRWFEVADVGVAGLGPYIHAQWKHGANGWVHSKQLFADRRIADQERLAIYEMQAGHAQDLLLIDMAHHHHAVGGD